MMEIAEITWAESPFLELNIDKRSLEINRANRLALQGNQETSENANQLHPPFAQPRAQAQ